MYPFQIRTATAGVCVFIGIFNNVFDVRNCMWMDAAIFILIQNTNSSTPPNLTDNQL